MDRQLTFEITLYLNIFYFALYSLMEFIFLIIKFYHVEHLNVTTLLNETMLLVFLVIVETVRLFIGQEENLGKKISAIFRQTNFRIDLFSVERILVLSVPSFYLVAYFTFWQTRVTHLDAVLGIVLLVLQTIQMSCAVMTCLPNRSRICWNPFETDFEKIN